MEGRSTLIKDISPFCFCIKLRLSHVLKQYVRINNHMVNLIILHTKAPIKNVDSDTRQRLTKEKQIPAVRRCFGTHPAALCSSRDLTFQRRKPSRCRPNFLHRSFIQLPDYASLSLFVFPICSVDHVSRRAAVWTSFTANSKRTHPQRF